MKTIYHINEPGKWPQVLENVRNMLKFCRDAQTECVVEVLANGPAVLQLTEAQAKADGHYDVFARLADTGASFAACRNAMRKYGVAEQSLCPFVQPVPAGVVELSCKQAQGYAYIKP